jgi:hypothetical protein
VRPRSWWIDRFAERLAADVEFDASFVALHAMRFKSSPATVS